MRSVPVLDFRTISILHSCSRNTLAAHLENFVHSSTRLGPMRRELHAVQIKNADSDVGIFLLCGYAM